MRAWRGLVALVTAATVLTASGAAVAGPISPQVVNGRDPEPGEARALVSVSSGGLSCGGTLVDANHVITAAHCITSAQGVPTGSGLIRVGWSGTTSRAATTLPVRRTSVHPMYDPSTLAFDIAVLELTSPIPGATPMLVASAARSALALQAGSTVSAAGFGSTSVDGPVSNRMQVADLMVIPDRVCSKERIAYRIGTVDFYGYGREFDAGSAVCAIGVIPNTELIIDTCQGDSGGPLYAGSGVSARLIGVVSMGEGCAGFSRPGQEMATKRPGVYTETGAALTWLAAEGIDMSDTVLASPIIAAAIPEPGSINVTVTPGSSTRLDTVSVEAVNVGTSNFAGSCLAPMVSGTATCRIDGLAAGESYSLTAVASSGDLLSAASDPVTVTLPARPVTPRIREVNHLGGGRVQFVVVAGASKAIPLDPTTVGCLVRDVAKTEVASVSGALMGGIAELQLVTGHRYTCRATSTNAWGSSRSRPEILSL